MNVVNPPVFDHVVFPDAISRVPFTDIISVPTFSIGSLGTFSSTVLVAPRNYTNARLVSAGIRNTGSTEVRSCYGQDAGGNHAIFWCHVALSSAQVLCEGLCTTFSLAFNSPTVELVVSGWI